MSILRLQTLYTVVTFTQFSTSSYHTEHILQGPDFQQISSLS